MIVITTGQCASIATVATAAIGTSPSGLLERLLYSMVCAPCQARTPYCPWLERFLPLLPPRGKGRSGAHGSLVERLRTTDRLGATELGCHREVPPPRPNPVPSRCQTLMPDPDACHADPAATPRRRTPPSDPAIGSRGRSLLSVIRSGYIYEICVCIECVTLHVVHA